MRAERNRGECREANCEQGERREAGSDGPAPTLRSRRHLHATPAG